MDSIQILHELNWPIPKGNRSGNIPCPYHTDKSPSMSINLEKSLYHCFSCGRSGSLIDLLNEKEDQLSPEEILQRRLQNYTHPTFSKTPKVVKDPWFTAEYKDYGSDEMLDIWLAYRGLPSSVKEQYGMHFGDIKITYNLGIPDMIQKYTIKDRLSIPIYENGKLISVEMRSLIMNKTHFDDDIKKCVYPKGSKVSTLFEKDKLDYSKPLVILEGLMDLIAFRSLIPYANSTSIFGAAISDRQANELSKFKKVTYIYNDDVAGRKSVVALKQHMSKTTPLFVIKPLFGADDVGEMIQKYKEQITPEVLQKWMTSAKSL